MTSLVPVLSTFSAFIQALHGAKRIIAVAGAGMSTPCGIPDFRSKEGLYALAEEQGIDTTYGLGQPEDLFSIEFFEHCPDAFFAFASKNLLPPSSDGFKPSLTHLFLKELDKRGKLLRVYTQNVDGIEIACGLDAERVVQCHGTLATATCRECKARYMLADIKEALSRGEVPRCTRKTGKVAAVEVPVRRSGRKRKRTAEGGSGALDPTLCNGVVKPDITFFGEPVCASVAKRLTKDRWVEIHAKIGALHAGRRPELHPHATCPTSR